VFADSQCPAAVLFGLAALLLGRLRVRLARARPRRTNLASRWLMKSLANEFFKTMADGAAAHQRQHAAEYDLLVNGIKDELDVARQIDLVEQMIAERVDALVLAPADSRALVPVTRRALEAGLVVVNIDNRLDAAVLHDQRVTVPFVGPDNRKGARLVGEAVAARLARGDAVAILEGCAQRVQRHPTQAGLRRCRAGGGAAAGLVADCQLGGCRREPGGGRPSSRSTRTSRPFLCANDSMALGAVAAVRAARAGRPHPRRGVRQHHRGAAARARRAHAGDGRPRTATSWPSTASSTRARCSRARPPPSDRETPVDLITADKLR